MYGYKLKPQDEFMKDNYPLQLVHETYSENFLVEGFSIDKVEKNLDLLEELLALIPNNQDEFMKRIGEYNFTMNQIYSLYKNFTKFDCHVLSPYHLKLWDFYARDKFVSKETKAREESERFWKNFRSN